MIDNFFDFIIINNFYFINIFQHTAFSEVTKTSCIFN